MEEKKKMKMIEVKITRMGGILQGYIVYRGLHIKSEANTEQDLMIELSNELDESGEKGIYPYCLTPKYVTEEEYKEFTKVAA